MTAGVGTLAAALAHGAWLAFPLAFTGGVVMGLNPCCLALYPAVTATCCCGSACAERPRLPLRAALGFVLGLAVATAVLGLSAAALGRSLIVLPGWARAGIGFIPLLMGAHVLGWIRLPLPTGAAGALRGGFTGAFLTGLLLSLVLGPCGTPVLVALLTYAAVQGHLLQGGLLMASYGLGNGLPVLLAGTLLAGLVQRLLEGRRQRMLEAAAGASLLALGYYLIWTLA